MKIAHETRHGTGIFCLNCRFNPLRIVLISESSFDLLMGNMRLLKCQWFNSPIDKRVHREKRLMSRMPTELDTGHNIEYKLVRRSIGLHTSRTDASGKKIRKVN